jgi:hypothetical protein
MALRSGTRVGADEILAPIGAGAMGAVYRAKAVWERPTSQSRGRAHLCVHSRDRVRTPSSG